MRKSICFGKIFNIVILFILISLQIQNKTLCQDNTNLNGWQITSTHAESYQLTRDKESDYKGKPVYCLKSISNVQNGFGATVNSIEADQYMGKRVRMTCPIKTDNLSAWAGLWMRVDGLTYGVSLQFDNMHDRPIKGTTDWTIYEIVLDVPSSSTSIIYGVLLNENGEVRHTDPAFEVVSEDVPTTNLKLIKDKD
jgi:hypothetical protein